MAYDTFDRERKLEEAEARQHEERRKAHADSLLRIRAAQDEQERARESEERLCADVIHDLKMFYLDSVLVEKPLKQNVRFGLPGCSSQDLKLMRQRLQIFHDSGDWYRVKLVSAQGSLFRYVKVLVQGRDIVLDEVR